MTAVNTSLFRSISWLLFSPTDGYYPKVDVKAVREEVKSSTLEAAKTFCTHNFTPKTA